MDKLSNRKKFFGVMIITLVLLIAAWYRMLNPTLTIISDCSRMEKELDSTMASNSEILIAKASLARLNELIGNEEGLISQINRELVAFVANQTIDKSALLADFSPVHQFINSQYSIYTHRVEIQGSYTSILQTLYNLEHEFRQARVCSAQFYTRQELRTKKKYLYGVFYVQNIRKNS